MKHFPIMEKWPKPPPNNIREVSGKAGFITLKQRGLVKLSADTALSDMLLSALFHSIWEHLHSMNRYVLLCL